jgi:hypothetical protein
LRSVRHVPFHHQAGSPIFRQSSKPTPDPCDA